MMSSPSSLRAAVRGSYALCGITMLMGGCIGPITEDEDEGEDTTINSVSEPRYYDDGEGTVADAKTWLTWQQEAAPGLYSWAGAKQYCATLRLAGGGWTLPTLPNLETLVDTLYSPTIDPVAFPDAPVEWTWAASSSPYVGPEGDAWAVNFANGESLDVSDTNLQFAVRCVRGGR